MFSKPVWFIFVRLNIRHILSRSDRVQSSKPWESNRSLNIPRNIGRSSKTLARMFSGTSQSPAYVNAAEIIMVDVSKMWWRSGKRTFLNRICWVYSFKCLNSNNPCFHCPLQCDVNQVSFNGWQLAKWKRVFLTCPCHEIYRDEAVGLESCKNTWKITIFVKMWNLGQNRENLIFCP